MSRERIGHHIMRCERLHKDSGQALVETAVSLSFLVVLLLGAVEFGRVAYASIEMSNAARAGVQYAAMNGGHFTDTAGIIAAAQADAFQVYNANMTGFYVTSSFTCVCANGANAMSSDPQCTGYVTTTSSGGTIGNVTCPNSHELTTVTVQTQGIFDPLIHLPGLGTTFTLHGQAIQQVLQ
ncbi:MAG: pilus assembly protein [Acidobacteriota bacterium]|nr:pilus assembly protein [Acidobacteriota bacterium]